MKRKEPVQYTVEREYLSKFSVEELLIRIIKARLNQNVEKGNMAG